MSSTREQKAKEQQSRQFDMKIGYDNAGIQREFEADSVSRGLGNSTNRKKKWF